VQQLELHIKQLEDDSLSSAPDLNTQIAVLNKINAANVLLVRREYRPTTSMPCSAADWQRCNVAGCGSGSEKE